jgi:hypothetical protein
MSTTGIVKCQDVDDGGAGVAGVVGAGGMGVAVADVAGAGVAEELCDEIFVSGYFHDRNAETRGAMRGAQFSWKA